MTRDEARRILVELREEVDGGRSAKATPDETAEALDFGAAALAALLSAVRTGALGRTESTRQALLAAETALAALPDDTDGFYELATDRYILS